MDTVLMPPPSAFPTTTTAAAVAATTTTTTYADGTPRVDGPTSRSTSAFGPLESSNPCGSGGDHDLSSVVDSQRSSNGINVSSVSAGLTITKTTATKATTGRRPPKRSRTIHGDLDVDASANANATEIGDRSPPNVAYSASGPSDALDMLAVAAGMDAARSRRDERRTSLGVGAAVARSAGMTTTGGAGVGNLSGESISGMTTTSSEKARKDAEESEKVG
jgi:hypothetical protein